MVRLAISVEGQTEEQFIKQLLVPLYAPRNLYITPIILGKGGGAVCINRIRIDMRKLLSTFDFVTTLYDFYGFKNKDPNETKETLEKKILDAVPTNDQDKVFPYIQLYEFEALLFSSPQAIGTATSNPDNITWAQGILNTFQNNPEQINDSPQTAPSKRLGDQFRYRKTTHGPSIAKDIGLDTIRSQCAGFNAWMMKIEELI